MRSGHSRTATTSTTSASGPINLNNIGDPTAGVYDVFRYRDGKVEVFSEVPIEPPK